MPAEKNPPRALSRRARLLRFLALLLGLPVLALVLVLLPARPLPGPLPGHADAPTQPFDTFFSRQLERARQEGVRPGDEERFIRRADPQTDLAILYVHGFGASRAEGESVVDVLGEELHANTYFMRLPGHGINMEAHAQTRWEQYLAAVEETFHQTRPLGKYLVLIGSSTGGLLCTWLASRHPNDVSALVLASPLFAFGPKLSFLFSRRAGMPLIEMLYGPIRDASWKNDPEGRALPGYNDHWLIQQRYRALLPIDDLIRTLATEDVFRDVTSPVLLLSYFKDEQHKDNVVDIAAMHDAFARMNAGSPHPLSREVAIADGNHILLSAYVRTDKAKIINEMRSFLVDVAKIRSRAP